MKDEFRKAKLHSSRITTPESIVEHNSDAAKDVNLYIPNHAPRRKNRSIRGFKKQLSCPTGDVDKPLIVQRKSLKKSVKLKKENGRFIVTTLPEESDL